MRTNWKLVALLVLGLLAAAPQQLYAYEPDPTTPAGYPRRSNPNGVEFGSNIELGASGSTPGIILNREDSTGRFQAQAAGTDEANVGWGLLGLLGLLGLAGLSKKAKI